MQQEATIPEKDLRQVLTGSEEKGARMNQEDALLALSLLRRWVFRCAIRMLHRWKQNWREAVGKLASSVEADQKIVEQVFTVVVGMHTHPVGMSTELKDAQNAKIIFDCVNDSKNSVVKTLRTEHLWTFTVPWHVGDAGQEGIWGLVDKRSRCLTGENFDQTKRVKQLNWNIQEEMKITPSEMTQYFFWIFDVWLITNLSQYLTVWPMLWSPNDCN